MRNISIQHVIPPSLFRPANVSVFFWPEAIERAEPDVRNIFREVSQIFSFSITFNSHTMRASYRWRPYDGQLKVAIDLFIQRFQL